MNFSYTNIIQMGPIFLQSQYLLFAPLVLLRWLKHLSGKLVLIIFLSIYPKDEVECFEKG